ncbi:28623_t:CDS:1, partial [Racocetra persica]
ENKKSRCRKGSYEKSIRQSCDVFVDDYDIFQVFRKSLCGNLDSVKLSLEL